MKSINQLVLILATTCISTTAIAQKTLPKAYAVDPNAMKSYSTCSSDPTFIVIHKNWEFKNTIEKAAGEQLRKGNYKRAIKLIKTNLSMPTTSMAQHNIAVMYFEGFGVVKNYRKAYFWRLINEAMADIPIKELRRTNGLTKHLENCILTKKAILETQAQASEWIKKHRI